MRRIRSGPTKGKGTNVSRLTPELSRADKNCMDSTVARSRRRAPGERGQAMVEFALLAPLFLMLVIGVIQFGVAINFWFDLQRLANQGARSAAVNCGPATGNQCGTNLKTFLEDQIISRGNRDADAEICYVPPTDPAPAGWAPSSGDAIRVKLTKLYRLQAVVRLAKIDLTATATMRLEQEPTSTSLPQPLTDTANWVLKAHTGSARCKP
jgi:hypothetical protein